MRPGTEAYDSEWALLKTWFDEHHAGERLRARAWPSSWNILAGRALPVSQVPGGRPQHQLLPHATCAFSGPLRGTAKDAVP